MSKPTYFHLSVFSLGGIINQHQTPLAFLRSRSCRKLKQSAPKVGLIGGCVKWLEKPLDMALQAVASFIQALVTFDVHRQKVASS